MKQFNNIREDFFDSYKFGEVEVYVQPTKKEWNDVRKGYSQVWPETRGFYYPKSDELYIWTTNIWHGSMQKLKMDIHAQTKQKNPLYVYVFKDMITLSTHHDGDITKPIKQLEKSKFLKRFFGNDKFWIGADDFEISMMNYSFVEKARKIVPNREDVTQWGNSLFWNLRGIPYKTLKLIYRGKIDVK